MWIPGEKTSLVVLPPQIDHGIHQIRFGQLGSRDRGPLVAAVGVRRDRDAVLGEHGTDRLDAELAPVVVEIGDDYRSRRSSSAWAKNADAVFRISLARRSSAFSFVNRAFSSASDSPDDSTGRPSRPPRSNSAGSPG